MGVLSLTLSDASGILRTAGFLIDSQKPLADILGTNCIIHELLPELIRSDHIMDGVGVHTYNLYYEPFLPCLTFTFLLPYNLPTL